MADRNGEHRYGIGAVARLTGLTDHTIRVWERRYGAVVAGRAPNGRREYTARDVEKLGILRALTERGIAIGRIANDSVDELRERVAQLAELPARASAGTMRAAMLGDRLAARYSTGHAADGIEVAATDTDAARLVADVEREPVDVIVVERPVLDEATLGDLLELRARTRAPGMVIVYGFGRRRDARAARDAGIVALPAPAGSEALFAAIAKAGGRHGKSRPAPAGRPGGRDAAPGDWAFPQEPAPRRFSDRQLASLSQVTGTIDCECPRHLARLVADLSAFEVYSANCANRDDDDAALHRYLHHTTAAARARIERALERVAKAEGLDY